MSRFRDIALLSMLGVEYALAACPASAPSPLPDGESDPYWAGADFWRRRHAAKLAEIAEGPKEYDFVFVGDSITHNWEGWSDPLDIAKVERAHASGELKVPNGPGRRVWNDMKRRFRLLNLGVGGDATQNVLWRLKNGELDGYSTRGVVLMIGTNNEDPPEETALGVKAILDEIAMRQPLARTILLPIFPCMERPDDLWRLRNDRVNGMIRAYADGERVVWCDFNMRFLGPDGRLSPETMPDFLHPLESGYRIWRSEIEPLMERIAIGFHEAQPVWVRGAEDETNAFYGFSATFRAGKDAVCRFSAASIARVFVNGCFAGCGPARSAEGWMRVDEIPIGDFMVDGTNVVAVEVSSPRVPGLYLMDREPFLAAEIVSGGRVVAATGRDFKALNLPRVRKTSRFTYQRGPAEFMRIRPGSDDWRKHGVPGTGLPLSAGPSLRPAERGVPLPRYSMDGSFRPTARLGFARGAGRKGVDGIGMDGIGKDSPRNWGREGLEIDFYERLGALSFTKKEGAVDLPVRLASGEGVVFVSGAEVAGFPRIEVDCSKPGTVWLVADEYPGRDGIPDFLRFGSGVNAVGWELLEPGHYEIEGFEPNAIGCAAVLADGCDVTLRSFDMRTYAGPRPGVARLECGDPGLTRIFDAAKRSLAYNAVDGFTDCPGRERGIYFGDTVFTSRAGEFLMGDLRMEEQQFLNYAMAPRFRDVPEGMVPMCYPADVTLAEPHWIPNFGLWAVIELLDCMKRGGDRRVAEAFRSRAEGLLAWFRRHRNVAGLLEDIPGWVFVEWSEASNCVEGVSYVTNMTYAKFLDAMWRLYGIDECRSEAERVRSAIRRESKEGMWYRDSSKSSVRSEACQYYAFYTGTATPANDGELWRTVVERLGPMRKDGVLPEIVKSDLLFGYSLRFVLLSEAGMSARVLDEVKACYGPMAAKTGTLWEGMDVSGDHSCCHGFPSLAAWLIAREALGVRRIDHAGRTVELNVPKGCPLDRCEGVLPLGDARLELSWRRKGGAVEFDVKCPDGWRVVGAGGRAGSH